jgi:hypothetical protein
VRNDLRSFMDMDGRPKWIRVVISCEDLRFPKLRVELEANVATFEYDETMHVYENVVAEFI